MAAEFKYNNDLQRLMILPHLLEFQSLLSPKPDAQAVEVCMIPAHLDGPTQCALLLTQGDDNDSRIVVIKVDDEGYHAYFSTRPWLMQQRPIVNHLSERDLHLASIDRDFQPMGFGKHSCQFNEVNDLLIPQVYFWFYSQNQ